MRVRKLSPSGDMMFGRGQADYWTNRAEGVGQLVGTRLKLWLGQWYLNVDDGTPYLTRVLGKYTEDFRDAAIQQRILGTPNVTGLEGYNSQLDRQPRVWTVAATVSTSYGTYKFLGPI
jgi:hypothetical protein